MNPFFDQPIFEPLEDRRLLSATIPANYSKLQTVQIRPLAATYPATVTLLKGVSYFIVADGQTLTSGAAYHGDAAFAAGATAAATTWGISVIQGTTSGSPADWGAFQADHVYGQTITPTADESVSFSFANDAKDAASTLAVTIYGPNPSVQVSKMVNNVATGFVANSTLSTTGIYIPVNNADWDKNGTADNVQTGAVNNDQFLIPIKLPVVAGAKPGAMYTFQVPKGLRLWANHNRTGKAQDIALPANKTHVVYLEGVSEQPKVKAVKLKVFVPYLGKMTEQDVKVTVFRLNGNPIAAGNSTHLFKSDSPAGTFTSAVGGKLDTAGITKVSGTTTASITWNNTSATDLAVFSPDADFAWGWPVDVTKV